jgi:hypothetical protein
MSATPFILCYGHDVTLLQTRQQILQREGFTCGVGTHESQLKQWFRRNPIDVLVIATLFPSKIVKRRSVRRTISPHRQGCWCLITVFRDVNQKEPMHRLILCTVLKTLSTRSLLLFVTECRIVLH